jgi:hypothetical protein
MQIGHMEFFCFDYCIQDHELMKGYTFAKSLITATAAHHLRKAAKDIH